jgi:hypothetical protein
MFNFIRRILFGTGTARFEFRGLKGNEVVSGSLKLPYVGQWDEEAATQHARDFLIVEQGVVPITLNLIGRVEK